MIVNYEIVTSYYICSQLLSQNQSIYAETESTFVITFTFAVVQKPKCPIKLMTKAGIYGFRSSPSYDSQLRDSNFVLHLQSIARSKPKLLSRVFPIHKTISLCSYIHSHHWYENQSITLITEEINHRITFAITNENENQRLISSWKTKARIYGFQSSPGHSCQTTRHHLR